MKPTRIVIFAKAPQPGFAKTRLIPALGRQAAADLARRLLERTLHIAVAGQIGVVELCGTPDMTDPAWQTVSIPASVQRTNQGEGDLGERLARAAKRVVENGEAVLLIGTDCPELSAEILQQAANALHSNDAALFPTVDGGYALLGLTQFHPSLFEQIAWSTRTVAFETLCRIGALGWSVQNHSMLHDIDEPADLKWLPQDWCEENHVQG